MAGEMAKIFYNLFCRALYGAFGLDQVRIERLACVVFIGAKAFANDFDQNLRHVLPARWVLANKITSLKGR